MKKIKTFSLIACALLVATNCATYRMSEQKQKEVTAAPHGWVEFDFPEVRDLDSSDAKWTLQVMNDRETFVRDGFEPGGKYALPMPVGQIKLRFVYFRDFTRFFRGVVSYETKDRINEVTLDIQQGKTQKISFVADKNRKVAVGETIVFFLFTTPIGWPFLVPSQYHDVTYTIAEVNGVPGDAAKPAEAAPVKKKKGK